MENKNCEIVFNDETKKISGYDFIDTDNQPAFYTAKKRNYKKAKEFLENNFNQETKYRDIINFLEDFNMEVHTHYMMD